MQVLRLQPGGVITLFNGEGGEHSATILRMGRSDVAVRIDTHHAIEREPQRPVHLAVGMPANDRMDWLVEKATELGVASIQPLHTAHSVLRLSGERATKKQAHWQQVAVAACEQCGGNRVPVIHPVRDFSCLAGHHPDTVADLRCVLSLAEGSQGLADLIARRLPDRIHRLSSAAPKAACRRRKTRPRAPPAGLPVTLGGRVLRAETAALSALVRALG